jgi:starch phosphorylase
VSELDGELMQQLAEETEQQSLAATGRRLPEPLKDLDRLSLNYWWSWSATGTAVFRDLDPNLWEECEQNPRLLLAEVLEYRMFEMATDPLYVDRVSKLAAEFDNYMADPATWGGRNSQITREQPVAYFCADFGVHQSLPLYSGGLGILAGDHLKSASDLNLPLVAVGLLYRYGYFRQRITKAGFQEEHYGETRTSTMPITLVRDKNGEPLMIEVQMRGRKVTARVWLVNVGRVSLYLLDTNIPENEETDRWVTGHLYGGDRETRVVQEMMLGIGGVRLLRRLGVTPHVYHLNEGHSAFLTLELARELVQGPKHLTFNEAKEKVRELCVFTTHTPIAAGNDEFDTALIEKTFGTYYEEQLGLDHKAFLGLGRTEPDNQNEWFGLTPLAIRMCRSTNGVSKKHGEVSQELWLKMFPAGTKVDEVPIISITNGVHMPTWVSPLLRKLLEDYIGKDWSTTVLKPEEWRKAVASIPDAELWRAHGLMKQRLVAFIRHRAFYNRMQLGESVEYTDAARTLFNPNALTIGFARRVAAYKRWNLLMRDPGRLIKILMNAERPVQFVFAGKAHPQDQGAKLILQQLFQWKYDPIIMQRAVFIQDYDQEIARQMVQSVDVWLNVPRRPLEASGTSGEKVALNGGLNLSILDGWWLEGYDGSNGWAIGDTARPESTEEADSHDAESLYRTLEEAVVPLYYQRDGSGLPREWIAMMKNALSTLAPAFNSDRMVQDYATKIYQ